MMTDWLIVGVLIIVNVGLVIFFIAIIRELGLFCNHRWTVKEWYPMDKNDEKLFEDTGVFASCEKCGKTKLVYPTIPRRNQE